MLSRSFDSSADQENDYAHDVSVLRPGTGREGLQDDVERLLDIAGQLFSAIEYQIHRIEKDLASASRDEVREYAQTVFKERMINCAESLELSIQEIGLHLEQRAQEHISNYGLREGERA
jgi:hypothetical protein